MKSLKIILSLLLCLVLAFPLCSCSNSADAYIYFELPFVPETLDPQIASTDSELLIVKNVYEGLLRKDENGKIVPAAAKDYKKDGLTYTFNIKDNLKWSNGDKLTAADFEFALKRAVNPVTKAPFVSRLFSIANAKEIYYGNAPIDSLGVKAESDDTLKITLAYEDSLFTDALTTSIAMPCNEKVFNESDGKYGIFADKSVYNGSYELSRWRKESFGIRLYKNKEYNGNFHAKNAAVFLTCNNEDTLGKLKKNSIDMAFIDTYLTDEAENSGLKTSKVENICWVLTVGNEFSSNMRKSLSLLLGEEVFKNSLKCGYRYADSIFPSALGYEYVGTKSYNVDEAKSLYLQEIIKLESKKFSPSTALYYYNDGASKSVVTDIVGHWQSNLSAFVNIEEASEADLLLSQLTDNTYSMAIFPVRADSGRLYEYLEKYNITYNGQELSDIENQISKSNYVFPIMYQNTVIAYSTALSNVAAELGNGYIDFAYIVKTEK